MTEPLPSSFGRFSVLREIGRGGMGRVFEGFDPSLDRRVAIKTVWSGPGTAPPDVESFVAEAKQTARLEHPGIVPVHEVGRTETGEVYFVMRLVEGLTLREVLDRLDRDGADSGQGGWTRGRLLPAFVQVCRAVAFAHDAGVLHRDLKPDNLMLGRFGEVYVLDWGVARRIGAPPEPTTHPVAYAADGETIAAGTVGTPGYMSPEQSQGQLAGLDARADVWSLGAILFEILAGERAHAAGNPYAAVFAAVTGDAPDPAARAPGRRIPDSIAQVCRQALAPSPADRFADAEALAQAVEAHLEGARRREEADVQVARAFAAWTRFGDLATERARLTERRDALGDGAAPWVPLEDRPELSAVRERLRELGPEHATAFGDTVAGCEAALASDPDHDSAHGLLADAYWSRFEDAEVARDGLAMAYFARRILQHDPGRYGPRLEGSGTLTLVTEPPGAEVRCREFDRRGLVWLEGPERFLGVTPLLDAPLAMGSYRLILQHPQYDPVVYPVLIERGGRWSSGGDRGSAHAPLPLVPVPDDLIYVPAGPTITGGDPEASCPSPRRWRELPGFLICEHPVTCGEWCEYLNDLADTDPDAAFARVPRLDAADRQHAELWPRQDRYEPPVVDRDGDAWQPDWPISGIHWQDARDYADWRARRDGLPWRLPTEAEWEKAGRGVDGRHLPWGDEFHPSLCKMRRSRPGRAGPEPVGSFAADVSVYGVRDLAGGIREWCGDPAFDGREDERPVKGGSWGSEPRTCRLATRMGLEPWYVVTTYGFRLARDLPAG